MKEYRVFGNYGRKSISETINASSKKQAKLRAGFKTGFGGSELRKFMKSRNIQVRLV